MSRRSRFFMLAFLHLTVALLLAVVGYGISKSVDTYSQPTLKQYVLQFSQQVGQDQVQASLNEKSRKLPDRPEELPAPEEVEEITEEEERCFDDDFLFLHLLTFRFSVNTSLALNTHHLESPSFQASIPLYVLFHCWKNFLS